MMVFKIGNNVKLNVSEDKNNTKLEETMGMERVRNEVFMNFTFKFHASRVELGR